MRFPRFKVAGLVAIVTAVLFSLISVGGCMSSGHRAFVEWKKMENERLEILSQQRREDVENARMLCSSALLIKNGYAGSAGISIRDISVRANLVEFWEGILTDPGFRSHLIESDESITEFQKAVVECQNEYLGNLDRVD